jgi:tetratricopeptide (TPR) repeat protein
MSTAFMRGVVLYGQNRYDLADREFRQSLAEEPDRAAAHAYLALCMSHLDKPAEALIEADEAIRLDPDESIHHYARGRALLDLDRYREAETSAQKAVELEPFSADNFALLASIEGGRRHWAEALETATHGLEIDAEHLGCLNLRAMALVQLGRNDEAAHTLGSALADDPENAVTHANQGWNLLHQGNHEKALEHFREALRLDPELEWARVGIIESLKARHLIYRLMLRFFLWMGRQSGIAQWGVILAFVFGRGLLAELAAKYPAIAPWTTPILTLSFGFVLLTWTSSSVFNFLLQFNRFGRLALTREEKIEANVIGLFFMAAGALFLSNTLFQNDASFLPMVFFGLMLIPLAVTFKQPAGRPRLLMTAYTVVVAAMFVPVMSLILFGASSPFGGVKSSINLFQYFLYGAMFSSWIPAFLGLRDSRR